MNLEVDRISVKLDNDEFNCVVCLEIAIEAYSCSQCGKLLCKIDALRCGKNCPHCRGHRTITSSPFARRIIS